MKMQGLINDLHSRLDANHKRSLRSGAAARTKVQLA